MIRENLQDKILKSAGPISLSGRPFYRSAKIGYICRMKVILFLAIGLYASLRLPAQNDLAYGNISSYSLFDVNTEKTLHLDKAPSGKKLSLFIFLSPECPLCQNYSTLLNSLRSLYAGQVDQYGVIPGRAYPAKEVRAFGQKYGITFPLLIDDSKKFSNYLHATVTPEVILLGPKDELLYKGAIDDLWQDLGKRRLKATKNYLQDAMEASLHSKVVPVNQTKAVGCLINDF